MICQNCNRSMKRIMTGPSGPVRIEIFQCPKCGKRIKTTVKDSKLTIEEV